MNDSTRTDLPDPRQFDPEEQQIPHREEIPEILEFKLDFLMVTLHRIRLCLDAIKLLLAQILALLIWMLPLIAGLLGAILFQLIFSNVLLSLILFFILFIVIRVVVPFLIRQAQGRT